MNTVWVLANHMAYEGDNVYGVHVSLDGAKAAADARPRRYDMPWIEHEHETVTLPDGTSRALARWTRNEDRRPDSDADWITEHVLQP